jgi:hypothetical protein
MTRWLSTSGGDLDLLKLKTLASVFLALAGGLALIVGTLYQTFLHAEAETSGLLWMAGICVAPLTGGVVGAGIGIGSGRAQSRAIQQGALPGRRASDTLEQPTDGR